MRRLACLFCALSLLGCRRELPDPPDPNRPVPAVDCAEHGTLGFASVEPDSDLPSPPWLSFCALCPPGTLDVSVADEPLTTAWSADGLCLLAMPETPRAGLWTATVEITDEDQSGSFDFERDSPSGPGSPVAPSTWRLDVRRDNLRAPAGGSLPGPRTLAERSLLVEFTPTTDGVEVVFAATDAQGEQDLCVPPSAPVLLDERNGAIAGPLDGVELPLPLAGPLRRGALHGRLGVTDLRDLSLLAVGDAVLLEEATGVPPEDACTDLEAETGVARCGPCSEPRDGIDGLPTCITTVWEWDEAEAADPLLPVDPDALPPDCSPP